MKLNYFLKNVIDSVSHLLNSLHWPDTSYVLLASWLAAILFFLVLQRAFLSFRKLSLEPVIITSLTENMFF